MKSTGQPNPSQAAWDLPVEAEDLHILTRLRNGWTPEEKHARDQSAIASIEAAQGRRCHIITIPKNNGGVGPAAREPGQQQGPGAGRGDCAKWTAHIDCPPRPHLCPRCVTPAAVQKHFQRMKALKACISWLMAEMRSEEEADSGDGDALRATKTPAPEHNPLTYVSEDLIVVGEYGFRMV